MSGRQPISERMAAMISPEPNSGCWLWLGQVDKDGYAAVWDGDRKARAARVAYVLAWGKVPRGLVVDHRCNVRCCVNPEHLQAVSQAVNVQRQERVASNRCKRGHSLHDAYLHQSNGYTNRHCRECGRIRAREYQRSRRGSQ